MFYKVDHLEENPPKATHRQLAELIEDKSGLKLGCVQFERLFRKYITRPGKPAERYELAIQTKTGWPGVASEYRLTGVLRLMVLRDESMIHSDVSGVRSFAGTAPCSDSAQSGPPSITSMTSANHKLSTHKLTGP